MLPFLWLKHLWTNTTGWPAPRQWSAGLSDGWYFSWVSFTNRFTTWPQKSPFWRSTGGGTGLHQFTLLRFKAVVFWYSRSNCRPLLPCSYRFPCTSRWRSRDQKFRELHQLKPGEKSLTLLTGPACGQAGAREGARQKCLVRDVWHRAAAAAGLLGHPLSAYTQCGSDICLIPTSKLPTPIEDCKNKVGFKAWCMCYRVGPATTCLFLVQGFYFSFCVPVSV